MAKKIGFVVLAMIGAVIVIFNQLDPVAASAADKNLDPLPEGTFNVQIQALEVTQGIRGDIPVRSASGNDMTLLSDGATHVADRRTIVRAYPSVRIGANALVPPLTAQLWVFRDGELQSGSPLSPVNTLLENISPDRELKELRGEANLSWNFLLPSTWTAADPSHAPFSLRFVVEVNPAGPDHVAECQGCTSDNQISLERQSFVHVPPITIKLYLVDHTFTDAEGNEVNFPAPTLVEFQNAIKTVYRYFPIGDGEKGIVVLEPEYITWNGALKADGKHVFAESMIQQYLPGGSLKADAGGVIHVFLFNPSKKHWDQVNALFEGAKTGMAWIGKSYVQAGARGSELAHELAHAIGLDHAGNLHGEATSNPDYPDDCGRIEANAYGFDTWLMQAIPPDFDQDAAHDFMSYDRSNPEWVSLYTWNAIPILLGQPNFDL